MSAESWLLDGRIQLFPWPRSWSREWSPTGLFPRASSAKVVLQPSRDACKQKRSALRGHSTGWIWCPAGLGNFHIVVLEKTFESPSPGCGRPSGSHLSPPPPRPPSSSVSFQSPYPAPQGRRAPDAHWRTGQTESLRRPVRTPGGWRAGSSGASLRLELPALRRQRSGLCFHSEGTPIPPH